MEWSGQSIRVAVLAAAAALRAGLAALLVEAGLELVARSSRLEELAAAPADFDVLVWAPDAAELRALSAATRSLPEAALLLLVREPEDFRRLAAALGARPWGLLPLEAGPEELLAAVRALADGLVVADPALLAQAISPVPERAGEGGPGLTEPLTPRETQVLQRLAEGLTNKQIAYALGISEHTAKFHISSIYSKLGVMNRAEAVQVGVRYGLIVV